MATTAGSFEPYSKSTRRMSRAELLDAAAYFGVDPAGLETEALRCKVKSEAEARWLAENREAIDEFNAWVRENGIPDADLTPM
jgi:post-segregation antitoxin (ccd killing protein)